METSNTLERLNNQVAALITAVQQAREQSARLKDELTACQEVASQREQRISELEESVGLKDMELEDIAVRIEGVLSDPAAATPSAVSDAPAETAEALA